MTRGTLRHLHEIAAAEDVKVHDLLTEGINLVIRRRHPAA